MIWCSCTRRSPVARREAIHLSSAHATCASNLHRAKTGPKADSTTHRDRKQVSPTRERISGLLDRLRVDESSRVLDVGCGRGEMLQLLVDASGCTGVGVDPDEDELAIARERSPSRGQLVWHCARIADVDVGAEFDAAICVGATHAFGPPGQALPETLQRMSGYMREEGRLLVGDGHWKRDPPTAYLEATRFQAGDLREHQANGALGKAAGLTLIHSEVSSLEEWDHFETAFLRAAVFSRLGLLDRVGISGY